MFVFWGVLFLLMAAINFASSVAILRVLHRGGITGGSMETRWHIAKHLKTYKELCLKEQGRVGWPYFIYPASFFLLILCAVLALASIAAP